MSQQEQFYSYQQLHPPVMKDKSKNAARNRREKENGEWISCLITSRTFWLIFDPSFPRAKNVSDC